jgi:hypothetical protein
VPTIDDYINGATTPRAFSKFGSATIVSSFRSLWYGTGVPGAPATAAPGVTGAALTSPVSGQFPFPSAVADTSVRLYRFDCAVARTDTSVRGMAMLCDRLWHNSGLNASSAVLQNVNSVAFAARDLNGTADGLDVQVGIEIIAGGGANGSTGSCVISYTNQDGTAGKTGTFPSIPAHLSAGTFIPMHLAAGDFGVRSIQSITTAVSFAGNTFHLVAYRILECSIIQAGFPNDVSPRPVDPFNGCFEPIADDAVPFLIHSPYTTSAAARLEGQITWTQA